MYQTILFDLDGTLTDPKEGITKCVQCGLRAAEIVVDDLDQLTWFIGPPLLSSFRKYPGMDETRLPLAMQAFAERFQTKGLYENSLYPDTVTLLRALHAAGKRLALATAKPERYGVRILEHFGIRQYFDVVSGCTTDDKAVEKDVILQEALRRLRISESEKATAVMVGDRDNDILAAKVCGIPSIGVRFGYAQPGELERAGADHIFDTMEALQAFLLQ